MKWSRPSLRLAVWIGLGIGRAAHTFLFAYRFVLHQFAIGPYLWDQGWYAYAVFQNGFLLANPPFLRHSLGESLFTQHLYGLVSLASPVSYFFSTHYQYFATIVGAIHALGFLAAFLAVASMREPAERTWVHAVAAALAGLAFAYSGQALAALGYPHFEIAIPAFFLMFVALYFLGWRRSAWIPLLLGLLVREDAGLHYLTYFALIGLLQWRTGRTAMTTKTLVTATAVSLVMAVSMLVIQRHFFPHDASMFEKSFVGSPAFAHVTWAAAATRVKAVIASASAVYAPLLFIALAALLVRRPSYLLAYAACVPWVIINVFFSLTPAAQTLSVYYSFPLFVGLAWPLLAGHWNPARSWTIAWAVFVVACVLSAAVFPPHSDFRAASKAGGNIPASQYLRQRACLDAEFRSNGRLFADIAIVAMFPDSIPTDRVLRTATDIATADADGFVFYANDMASAYYERARALEFRGSAALKAPLIRLLSRKASSFQECAGR